MPEVFFQFQLPNATTWFYFSFLLAVALFFKFRRFLSIRNWDLISLFVLFPGLLLLPAENGDGSAATSGLNGLSWAGYVWLISGSAYFFIRCLLDLALIRRPALAPNLNPGGLTWLGCALFICLISVAMRNSADQPVGNKSEGQAEVERRVETAAGNVAGHDAPSWAHRILAIACHLAVVVGLVVVGWRHFQELHLGVAAATLYLLLPYTALHVGQLAHVWPTALLVWAVVFYDRPVLTGWLLGLAAGGAYYPVVVFPVWLSLYRGRGAGRFALAFALAAGLSLAAIASLLWFSGTLQSSVRELFELTDWQAWKEPSTESFWSGIRWVYRLPVFVLYLTFVITTAFWPSPKNLSHVMALSAANLIGIQFWYADQGGVYVLWYLPLMILLVFRPNLSEKTPPAIAAEPGRIASASRQAVSAAFRMLRGPDPVVRVQ